MRPTSQQWIENLQRILGGASPSVAPGVTVQPVRSAVQPWIVDDGADNPTPIPAQRRRFDDVIGNRYCQVIPSGLYDTVVATVVQVDGVASHLYPLFVSFERLQTEEGLYPVGIGFDAFLRAHPPYAMAPAATNGNKVEIEVPLTNSPLIVWAADPINPTSTVAEVFSVALFTRRH